MRLLLPALFAALLAAQNSSVIEVSVRSDGGRQPVPGASLILEGPSPGTFTTGRDGGYRFEKLLEGDYRLRVTAPGYLNWPVGDGAYRLALKDGRSEKIAVDLVSYCEMQGTVLDEEGAPLAGVVVYAGRNNILSTSDKDGHYRLEKMPPDEYKIILRVPFELRRQTLKRDEERGETFGYPSSQYYPGVEDFRSATPVVLTPGAILAKFDLHLKRSQLVGLSGRLIESAGRHVLRDAEVELEGAGFNPVDKTNERRAVDEQGGFRFDLIRPGRYSLLIFRGDPERDGSKLPHIVTVDVGKSGVENREIAVPRFVRIEGTVKAPDRIAKWSGTLHVTVRSAVAAYSTSFSVEGDHFAWENLSPGEWRIMTSGSILKEVAEPHRKLYVASARLGEQGAMSGPIAIAEGGNPPLEITLSDESGRISGAIADGEGGQMAVTIRRVDGEANAGLNLRGEFAQRDGTFLIQDLAPGEYELSGWRVKSDGSFATGPSQACAVKVKVVKDETVVVRVTVCGK